MPLLVYLNYAYVLPRFAVWVLLLVASFFDGWRHRNIRSRGYQLYWSLVGVILLFVLREAVLLACAFEAGGAGGAPNTPTFDIYIFFSNLADSVWFAILLSVGAGFCITRNSLGPHKNVVIIIPLIFFSTSLVVDYVLYYAKGFVAFDAETAYSTNPDEVPGEDEVSAVTGLVFFFCIVANMMTFMLAWFYIFDTIQKEREILEGRIGPDGAAVTAGMVSSAPVPGVPVPVAPGQDGGVGHREVPDDVLLLEEGGNASHLPVVYGGVADEDLDAPKTIQDRIETRQKIRLMRQFFYMVSFYVVATLLVLFLPIFVSEVVDKTMLILQNCVLWLFLAALCFIFRMRDDNPYLVLDEEGETGLGGVETTTELGVIVPANSGPGDYPLPPPSYNQVVAAAKAASRPGSGGAPPAAAPAAPLPLAPPPPVRSAAGPAVVPVIPHHQEEGGYAEQHFTLGDEEDEHEHRRIIGGPSSSDTQEPSSSANVNSDAAKQGVLVTVLPSPKVD